jgi:putative pyruvate formate lyase activating enzyme
MFDAQGSLGICGMPAAPVVARAAIHYWEEPCISGSNGSGTVFFSGCSLKCCYCQNYEISAGNFGKEISVQRLCEIYSELAAQGVHNINLVNPTHFIGAVAESLETPPEIPFVYNSGGYENVESLKKLKGKIQIYMPDFKYADNSCAVRYSKADGYFDIASKAIIEMYNQTGNYQIDENGILNKGILIRHLVLPGHLENSYGVIDWIADNFNEGQVLFSLMTQYTPYGRACEYPEINRKLTREEYNKIQNYLFSKNIEDGYVQELDSADESYIPDFDLQGV